ncbi:hypothetical protein M3Y99_01727500 [Aphelenchoides fujianensis]|nr:hypothetical protein M3Y99_01727500 [Aphelenchoides fujianensis]
MDSVSETSSTFDWESERASSSASISLDYSERELTEMPDEFFVLEEAELVTELDLSRNRFAAAPKELFTMSSLTSLNLSSNGLRSLPNDIAALQNLRRLDLRNNELSELPEAVCKLHNLEVLILSGNRFKDFPTALLHLPELVELQMGANRLDNVPKEISQLKSLEILYLGDNRLQSVPDSLGSLPRLTALALAQNRLETLPDSFSGLNSLRTLTLHNNRLRALPTGIARLPNLEQLNIRNNPLITKFVDDIVLEPPTLKELAARIVKLRLSAHVHLLPAHLQAYLRTANQCVNPKCKGVYFEACNESVKFVEVCGRYRVPLLQYLCSPQCSSSSPAYAISSSGESDDEEAQVPSTSQERMKKVLLG